MTDESKTSNTPETIEFPFRLDSELKKFNVAKDLEIRRMDAKTKKRLLGIENVKYTKNGMVNSFNGRGLTDTHGPQILQEVHFLSNNFLLTTTSRERAIEFNFALKLLKPSSTTLYVGYQSDSSGMTYVPACYLDLKLPALTVAQSEVDILKKITSQLTKRRNDVNLKLMSEIYMNTMSGTARAESRYIELSIILEILLLPENNAELAYRFRLRLAKFMEAHYACAVDEIFEQGKEIYNTRSKIVHTGKKNKNFQSNADTLHQYARMLLLKYIEDSKLFNEDKLEKLCMN